MHRLAVLLLAAAALFLRAQTARPPLGEAAALREIAAAVGKHSQAGEFSGVALVARGPQTLLEKATGYLSVNADAPNRPDTLFNIGSITKVFTKLCIARLWAEQELSLDDTIGKFLPGYPNREAAASVTIGHLLTMTSGIGGFFGPKYAATPKNRIQNLAGHVQFFASGPLAFKPGTSEKYSNGGYVVLGRIIEKVSGTSYYDFAAQTVFEPLGMKDTGFYEADVPKPRLFTGYSRPEPGAQRRGSIYTLSRRGSRRVEHTRPCATCWFSRTPLG
jgi:CubicO group peptidase (beta-lactamase class C family)